MGIGHVQHMSRVPWGECRMMNDECRKVGKSGPKPGTCVVQARYKPCAWEEIRRCKPGTCVVHATYKPGTSQEREESGAPVLPSRRARCSPWPNNWFVRPRGAKYLGESNPCTSCRLCRAR